MASVPWSIHIVQLDLRHPAYSVQSLHAGAHALGLDTLSSQLAGMPAALGKPMAAINADFYQRDKEYAGAPRGLQVSNGELLSAPSGGACFWIDAMNQPHTETVASQFQITWPDGSTSPFTLNGDRQTNGVELYTSAIGPSTLTRGGRELVLARAPGGPWLPLKIGRDYRAQVREVHEGGNTRVEPGALVLSLGPAFKPPGAKANAGDILSISTASSPAVHGIRTAIGGGPVLLRNGKLQTSNLPDSQAYEFSSMQEQHPRAAVGWNGQYLYLVEVDGRQKHLSIGMSLEELAKFLRDLGCRDAMNFDGGGSATLWFDGEVRNSPCDRMEREIANCLVIVKKER